MKIFIIGISALSILFTACNSADNKQESVKSADTSHVSNSTASAGTGETPIKNIVSHYLELKNALANDNGKEAATHGKAIMETIDKTNVSSLSSDQKKAFNDAAEDAKEMAEHISTNPDKIEHQREHFDMLSKDIYDLVKTFGAGQTLYQDFCPMYNDKKGASWLSETKEIKNPYMGKKMSRCGMVKEEIK